MKIAKRILAFALCLLMLGNVLISNIVINMVSDNDVVAETITSVEVCEECGGVDEHTEICSYNIADPLNEETASETTQTTTDAAVASVETSEVIGCAECGQTEGHLNTCSQYADPNACAECGQVEGHLENCSKYEVPFEENAEATGLQSGDKIWVKSGSLVYKSMDVQNGYEIKGNYEFKIKAISEDGLWYEIECINWDLGIVLALGGYKYVHIENTRVEEPEKFIPEATVGNVTISLGGIQDEVSLIVEDQKEAVRQAYSGALEEYTEFGQELAFAYDITPMSNGVDWQPAEGETVTVSLSGFNDVEDGQYMTILHIDGEGNVEALPDGGVVNNGKLTFQTNGFSVFAGLYDWAGTGTADDPFRIYTVRDLEYMAYCTANGQDLDNCYFRLEQNIDLSSDYGENINGADENWIPIGHHKVAADDQPVFFNGYFDGNNKTVSGLYINSAADNVGLFGVIGDGAVVRNLTVSGSMTGRNIVGGVIGQSRNATVSECTNQCIVEGKQWQVGDTYEGGLHVGGVVGFSSCSTITNCDNEALIKGQVRVGGIVGHVESSTINDCANVQNVTGEFLSVGGIAGWAETLEDSPTCIIKNCENSADIQNIYVGELGNYSITDSYRDSHVAGIVGSATNIEVSSCRNTGNITAKGFAGGIVGFSVGCTVTDCHNSNSNSLVKTRNGYGAGGIVGSSAGTSQISHCTNDGSVECNVFAMAGGIVGWCQDNHPGIGYGYEPETTVNASQISYCANNGNITSNGHHVDQWQDESYAGGISGVGGTIYNCYNTGTIRAQGAHGYDCPIFKVNYTGYGAYGSVCDAGRYAGGIVATDANVINCWNSGSVSGRDRVAGIVAVNNPRFYQVVNCYNVGMISCNWNDGSTAGIMDLSLSTGEGHTASWRNTVANCYNGGFANDPIVRLNLGWIKYSNTNLYAKTGSFTVKQNATSAQVVDDFSEAIVGLNAYVQANPTVTVQNGDIIRLMTWKVGANGQPAFDQAAEPTDPVYEIKYDLNDSTYNLVAGTFASNEVKVEAMTGDTTGAYLSCVNKNQVVINGTQYTFRTWNTKADGTGEDYAAGALLPTLNAEITLYAQWDIGWVLRYAYVNGVGNTDANDPVGQPGDIVDGLRGPKNMVPVDSRYYLTGEKATVYDYSIVDSSHPFNNDFYMGDFGYWAEKADGSGKRYYPGDEIEINGNTTLYAVVVYDLTIENAAPNAEDDEVFLYRITRSEGIGQFETMDVVVPANGDVTVCDVPAGTYTVTQLTDWSWRYDANQVVISIRDTTGIYDSNRITSKSQTANEVPVASGENVTFSSPDDAHATITFTNGPRNNQWLSGDCYAENWWGGTGELKIIKRNRNNQTVTN